MAIGECSRLGPSEGKDEYGPSSILVEDDLIDLIFLRTSFGLYYDMRVCQDLDVGGHRLGGGKCVREGGKHRCE